MVYWHIVSNGIDKQMANVTRNVKLDDEVYGYGFTRESFDRQCMRLLGFTLTDADLTWDSGGETCDIAKMVAVEGYVYCSFGGGSVAYSAGVYSVQRADDLGNNTYRVKADVIHPKKYINEIQSTTYGLSESDMVSTLNADSSKTTRVTAIVVVNDDGTFTLKRMYWKFGIRIRRRQKAEGTRKSDVLCERPE